MYVCRAKAGHMPVLLGQGHDAYHILLLLFLADVLQYSYLVLLLR